MATMLQDIRFAARVLIKEPGFAAVAVLTLALGIGVNTAIFSVADAFLLKPLPLPDTDRLAMVLERRLDRASDWNTVAPANFADWRAQNTTLEQMAAFAFDDVNLIGEPFAEFAQGIVATPNFFELLGAKAQLGRVFTAADQQPENADVVVLSYKLWQRRFGADPSIVGKTIKTSERTLAVIGVMGREFDFPMSAEMWSPLILDAQALSRRDAHYLRVVGRLKPGQTLERTRAEMVAITARLQQAYPQTNRNWGVRVMTVRDFMAGDLTRKYTLLLLGAVGFVLLIACANLANVQFARATRRQREIAVRLAMGAGRWRIVRHLLTESLLLALVGAAVGLLLAQWSIEMILAYMPDEVGLRFIPNWSAIRLDLRSFAYAFGVALISGVMAGLTPALRSSRPNVNETLKEGGRSGSATRASHRLRNILVAAQVALALILLVGAGLMVKGVGNVMATHQGFEPTQILTLRLNIPTAKYTTERQVASLYEQFLARLEVLPGIEEVSLATAVPFGQGGAVRRISMEGRPAEVGEVRTADWQSISPNFFRLLRAPLLEGREFGKADGPQTERVVIVSESLARRYWPGESPIGRRLKFAADNTDAPWHTVVGVVSDVKYDWFDRGPTPAAYVPYQQFAEFYTYVAVRTATDPLGQVPAVRAQLAALDPELPMYEVKTMEHVIQHSVIGLSYVAVMLTVLGAIALVLAGVGVYGVMAYAVSQRTHEIGVRMALGAQAKNILRMVVTQGMFLALAGALVGIVGSYFLAQTLAGLLFEVSASDPHIFIGVPGMLILVALAACYVPARRAARVDPIIALRYE